MNCFPGKKSGKANERQAESMAWGKHGAIYYRSLLRNSVPLDRFHLEKDGRGEEMKK
jgi:hypothetical protein